MTELGIPGSYRICPRIFTDKRGGFVKTFHSGEFARLGLASDFKEEFYSISNRNVLRGIHFQTPPCDHAKLVYCIKGAVLDVIVDLRAGSPSYGKFEMVRLDETNSCILYIPTGVGHGFLSLEDNSVMIYKTTTVHSPEHDAGIHWDSLGIPWPVKEGLVVSDRDCSHPGFSSFVTPFRFS